MASAHFLSLSRAIIIVIMYSFLIFTDEEVTGGQVKVSLKYGVIPIYSSTMDLCDLVMQLTSLKCPLAKGDHDVDIKQTIPGDAPSVRDL